MDSATDSAVNSGANGTKRAWKFLDERSRGMVTGFPWPLPPSPGQPGPWVVVDGPLGVCERGIHACRAEDLGWWLSAQLWEIEIGGEMLVDRHGMVAGRGRLVGRVAGWPGAAGPALAEYAVWRSRHHAVDAFRTVSPGDPAADELAACADVDELAAVCGRLSHHPQREAALAAVLVADNLTDLPHPVTACLTSARIAGHCGSIDGDADAYDRAFAAERQAQGRWLAAHLGLAGQPDA